MIFVSKSENLFQTPNMDLLFGKLWNITQSTDYIVLQVKTRRMNKRQRKTIKWLPPTYVLTIDCSVAPIKFIYSEKATKFCEISANHLTGST